MEIEVEGKLESIEIDAVRGPKVFTTTGQTAWLLAEAEKEWSQRDSADQKVLAYRAARTNREVRKLIPELERQAQQRALAAKAAAAEREVEVLRQRLVQALRQGSPREILEARCRVELARPPVGWVPIDGDKVVRNHSRRAPGMIYNLEFPWTADLLEEFGPQWLTKAFHAAGSLDPDNRVLTVTIEKNIKIDAGNNAGKFLFEVTYERSTADLDTLLFAKVPFQMTNETQADRISSSVLKQPMDLQEINTYRLVEAAFPMKTPKYYFGDVSNETSNFILVTARIPFAEIGKPVGQGPPLEPMEVEGPYDKCKDSLQLRGPPEEYYMLLMENSAKIAGLHRAGKFCNEDVLKASLRTLPADPSNPAAWGVNPSAATGEAPKMLAGRLSQAVKFVTSTASVCFPDYVASQAFQDKFTNTMMTWSAYSMEIQYWLHHNLDYVAVGHNNLNSDNAYFWRDPAGKLECGIIDWGGFGVGNLGHKMWWTFNCADYEQFQSHLQAYVDRFIAVYQENGGPKLDGEVFKAQVLMTSLGNMMFMVRAVPDCMKMCPTKEWATIEDRHDPRIAGNINGKSTLRTTLHVLNNGIRALEELGSDKVLQNWIQDVYVKAWGKTPKSDEVIYGK